MGIATFVVKMQLYNDEELAISFKNLTVNAEFKYLLSDEDLSASDTIVDKTNNSGADLTNNLIIKNISNKKYLYISFRAGLGQTSASVEDIQIEHNNNVTKYEAYVEDKIFILNDNNVYEEFNKKVYKEIETGVEFETDEIIDRKVVYKKIIDFGVMPNSTSKSVAHNITNGDKIIDVSIFCNNANGIFGGLVFPHIAAAGQYMEVQITTENIFISANKDLSKFNALVTIYYTKK